MFYLLFLATWSEVCVKSGRLSPFLPEEVRYVGPPLLDLLKWGQYPVREAVAFPTWRGQVCFPPLLNHLKRVSVQSGRQSPFLPEEVMYVGPTLLDHLKWGQCPVRVAITFPTWRGQVCWSYSPWLPEERSLYSQEPVIFPIPEEVKYVGPPRLDH